MNKIFYIVFALLLFFPAAVLSGDEKPFFQLAGRTFTLREARIITQNAEDVKTAVQANYAAAAAIVLCERAGVKLSFDETRRSLSDTLQLMSDKAKKQFDADLKKSNLTRAQWLDREAARLVNQMQDAVRRWYIKLYGAENPVTTEHIRSWYYRHQNIFRRTRVNPDWVWVFAQSNDQLELALSALRQGMNAQAVRTTYAAAADADKIAELLHNGENRTRIDKDYTVVNSGKYRLLLSSKALSHTYVPLDEKLSQVIREVLYDALAKARLAETMKKEFANQQITFY